MIKICSFFCLPIEEQRIGPVFSIANSYPRNVGKVHGKIKCLVPERKYVKAYKARDIDEEEFTDRYRTLVAKRAAEIKQWMDSIEPRDEMYLCCWEKTGFCHRYLVAKLFEAWRPDLEIRVT